MNNDIVARGCASLVVEQGNLYRCRTGNCCKLSVYDWMKDISPIPHSTDVVEVRFKNTRKGLFLNSNKLPLKQGDIIAVEASPGHDIGVVSLTGELVSEMIKRNRVVVTETELKKVYRKAKQADVEKWQESIGKEHETMIRARKIAENLKLNMKIGDVEYQGDQTKAIFYYIADDRVDFRELIKVLADEFKVRIEMRQIGARQEAGRIGGIGPCGRELCCATWIINFVSVNTSSARYQEISLNPQKLAGQCSKLKCCLNYELDNYVDARKGFPDTSIPLETEGGKAVHQKTDVHRRMLWYTMEDDSSQNFIPMSVEKVLEIMEMNRQGIKAKKLEIQKEREGKVEEQKADSFIMPGTVESDITRFDDQRNSRRRKKKKRNNAEDKGQNQ
jgi:cell fate regulator YaaT (PSP1 superfamily)